MYVMVCTRPFLLLLSLSLSRLSCPSPLFRLKLAPIHSQENIRLSVSTVDVYLFLREEQEFSTIVSDTSSADHSPYEWPGVTQEEDPIVHAPLHDGANVTVLQMLAKHFKLTGSPHILEQARKLYQVYFKCRMTFFLKAIYCLIHMHQPVR